MILVIVELVDAREILKKTPAQYEAELRAAMEREAEKAKKPPVFGIEIPRAPRRK